ncbi:hypothetical protein AGR4C_Lc120065 [Agrobacterium tumefaciens str. Kerr 14]|uniref:Uncharacterized protein n=1 Tax=Agrobacterium tumefaciens str. Kerr 14 TaxID=1183424 RepID=A0A1S7R8B4_AGRTU|nr:hypothetical protein AGR4C_Lc120065 [Agrobacterium tumefaciens str. Kerr 14]
MGWLDPCDRHRDEERAALFRAPHFEKI